ncbi:MAG: bestrophin family ion channel [Myxococcota bacterium]
MIITRRLPMRTFGLFMARTLGIVGAWAGLVLAAYEWLDWSFLRVPFLPIASIGTAVAFYIGFKNNSAYDRFWEGRKIWGGVVNVSRSWTAGVLSFVAPGHGEDAEVQAIKQELVYRHVAWVNALRLQLRKNSRFFHRPAVTTRRRLIRDAEIMRNDWKKELEPFLPEDELAHVTDVANGATHLLLAQGQQLAALVDAGKLDLFRQLQLMGHVTECYTLQGKCERIKNTPFPRQYAEMSRVFVRVFVLLLPLGMLDVFSEADTISLGNSVLMVISAALVGWVFLTMEGIGDSSEDPFERSMNDVPMNALSRTIEIDLREMLGETELPEKEKPSGHILY